MQSDRKILVISEGPNDKKFIRNLLHSFRKDTFSVATFKSNIWQLYDLLDSYNNDLSDVDVQSALLERASALTKNEREILSGKYSDIFLIFDFDPHDRKFSAKKISELTNHFCDSTDFGKLYINYPMLESFRHFPKKELGSQEISEKFQRLTFSETDLLKLGNSKSPYKSRVNAEGFTHYNLSQEQWRTIILNNMEKIRRIANPEKSPFLSEVLNSLLAIQVDNYALKGIGYVVNTSTSIIPEYFGERFLSSAS